MIKFAIKKVTCLRWMGYYFVVGTYICMCVWITYAIANFVDQTAPMQTQIEIKLVVTLDAYVHI